MYLIIIRDYQEDYGTTFYKIYKLCSTEKMVEDSKNLLLSLNIREKDIIIHKMQVDDPTPDTIYLTQYGPTKDEFY